MKKCTYCGTEYQNDATVCALDQQELVLDSTAGQREHLRGNYTLKKPDGNEVTLTREQLTIGYNTREINPAWPVKQQGGSEWLRVGVLLGVEAPGSDLAFPPDAPTVSPTPAPERKRSLFLFTWGWILVALNTLSIVNAVKFGLWGYFGTFLGISVGVGLIRGSGRAVLGLVALCGMALIFTLGAWPSNPNEVVHILGIPAHIFLLLNIVVFYGPPIVWGVIKRKDLM